MNESMRSNIPITVVRFCVAPSERISSEGIVIGLFALDEGALGKKLSLKNVSMMCSSSDNQTQLDCCGDEVSSGDVKWIRYVADELSNRYASCRDKCSILYVSGSLGTERIYVRQ